MASREEPRPLDEGDKSALIKLRDESECYELKKRSAEKERSEALLSKLLNKSESPTGKLMNKLETANAGCKCTIA